jgi:hypothetical protein
MPAIVVGSHSVQVGFWIIGLESARLQTMLKAFN